MGSLPPSRSGARPARNPNLDREDRRDEGSLSALGLGTALFYLSDIFALSYNPDRVDQQTKLERKASRERSPAESLCEWRSRGAPNPVGRINHYQVLGTAFTSGTLALLARSTTRSCPIRRAARLSRRRTAWLDFWRRRAVPHPERPGRTFLAGLATTAAMHCKESGRWRGNRPGAARIAAMLSTPPTGAERRLCRAISRSASRAPEPGPGRGGEREAPTSASRRLRGAGGRAPVFYAETERFREAPRLLDARTAGTA